MLDSESSLLQHRIQNATLIALSIFLLPLDTFILFCSLVLNRIFPSRVEKQRATIRRSRSFRPQTVLVTGVGMTKGLVLARNFYEAGHNVIGADFEQNGTKVCGRKSNAISKFVPLRKSNAREGSAPYIQSLLNVVQNEKVDLWVSCSGVASAVEDGEAKEILERRTSCKAIQFDVKTTQTLHEKHTFIERTKELDLTVPETHTITTRKAADVALSDAPKGRQYIMKTIGMDDSNRGDMSLLPKATPAETSKHLDKLKISEKSAWILQQFIKGQEFCTHALVVKGHVKDFVACPSAELLMHYEALSPESKLSQEMLKFTQRYAQESGETFTGHLSFDFLIEDADLQDLKRDPNAAITLYPIECNPRAHTAVALFNGTTGMAEAYLSLLNSDSPDPSYAEATANGTVHEHIITPVDIESKYYWIGHDLVNLLVLPLLNFLLLRPESSLISVVKGLDTLSDRLLFWKDGTYELWDPLPWWWLYHVYWPMQFLNCFLAGRKWSRINVSTCKMFEC